MKLNAKEIKMTMTLLEGKIEEMEKKINSESDVDMSVFFMNEITDYEMFLRKIQAEKEVEK